MQVLRCDRQAGLESSLDPPRPFDPFAECAAGTLKENQRVPCLLESSIPPPQLPAGTATPPELIPELTLRDLPSEVRKADQRSRRIDRYLTLESVRGQISIGAP